MELQSDRIDFLGIPLDTVDMSDAVALVTNAMRTRTRLQHGDVNVSKFIQMREDEELRRFTAESDLICIDGMGIILGCRLLGLTAKGRVTGIDLMHRTLEVCAQHGFRPYFLGAKPHVVRSMVEQLQEEFPELQVAGWRDGYFSPEDENDIVEEINASGADCLFVGITSPIKERFLNHYRDRLTAPLQIGVGGAFDVVSGNVKRAPVLVQKLGFEWFYRLAQEPRRLFYRYYKTNTAYAGILIAHILSSALGRTKSEMRN